MSWFYIFHLSNSSHICIHHVHHPKFSHTRLTPHPSMTTIFVLVLDLFILFSFFLFVILFFYASFQFFSRHIYTFFPPSFFKFNGVLFDFWVWGGSHDAQRVELFLTYWPKFTSEKLTQSKPSPDQTEALSGQKWAEIFKLWVVSDGQFSVRIRPKPTVVHPVTIDSIKRTAYGNILIERKRI
jgi:hypothetical protein